MENFPRFAQYTAIIQLRDQMILICICLALIGVIVFGGINDNQKHKIVGLALLYILSAIFAVWIGSIS